jgi:hypothetical protein
MNDYPQHWRELRPWRLLELLADEPVIGPALLALGRALTEEFDSRMLELIAVRVSALRDNRYVFKGHAYLATRCLRVLTVDEVARIVAGPDSLTKHDATLVRAVDELLNGSGLSSASQAALGSRAPRVAIAAAFYDLVATLMRDAEPESDVPVVRGLETPTIAVQSFNARSAAA